MIDVYGPNTPNVIKVTVCLAELGTAHRRLPLDIMKGEQFTPQFLAISPSNPGAWARAPFSNTKKSPSSP